jgi:hypothetical protein
MTDEAEGRRIAGTRRRCRVRRGRLREHQRDDADAPAAGHAAANHVFLVVRLAGQPGFLQQPAVVVEQRTVLRGRTGLVQRAAGAGRAIIVHGQFGVRLVAGVRVDRRAIG